MLVSSAAILVLCCASAGADDGYKVTNIEESTPAMAIVFAVVETIAMGVVAFKSSHRTHLD